jgi:hypothetical protein
LAVQQSLLQFPQYVDLTRARRHLLSTFLQYECLIRLLLIPHGSWCAASESQCKCPLALGALQHCMGHGWRGWTSAADGSYCGSGHVRSFPWRYLPCTGRYLLPAQDLRRNISTTEQIEASAVGSEPPTKSALQDNAANSHHLHYPIPEK